MCDMYGCVDESVKGKSIWSASTSAVGALLMASTAPDLADQLLWMLWMLSSSTYYVYLDLLYNNHISQTEQHTGTHNNDIVRHHRPPRPRRPPRRRPQRSPRPVQARRLLLDGDRGVEELPEYVQGGRYILGRRGEYLLPPGWTTHLCRKMR